MWAFRLCTALFDLSVCVITSWNVFSIATLSLWACWCCKLKIIWIWFELLHSLSSFRKHTRAVLIRIQLMPWQAKTIINIAVLKDTNSFQPMPKITYIIPWQSSIDWVQQHDYNLSSRNQQRCLFRGSIFIKVSGRFLKTETTVLEKSHVPENIGNHYQQCIP